MADQPSGSDLALLQDLALGKLPPDEVERLCAVFSGDVRLAQLAEAVAGQDTLLHGLRDLPTVPDVRISARVESLILRLVRMAENVPQEQTTALPAAQSRARPLPSAMMSPITSGVASY